MTFVEVVYITVRDECGGGGVNEEGDTSNYSSSIRTPRDLFWNRYRSLALSSTNPLNTVPVVPPKNPDEAPSLKVALASSKIVVKGPYPRFLRRCIPVPQGRTNTFSRVTDCSTGVPNRTAPAEFQVW